MTNVKPGQLAMFKPGNDNAGRIVRVIERDSDPRLLKIVDCVWWSCEALQHVKKWRGGLTTEPIGYFAPGERCPVTDSVLMPLHDGDGEDEILRIVGKPQQRDTTLTPRKQLEHVR